MKVWVVESWVNYEGSQLEAVFDSKEKADSYVKACEKAKEDQNKMGYSGYNEYCIKNGKKNLANYGDGMDVTEMEVQ